MKRLERDDNFLDHQPPYVIVGDRARMGCRQAVEFRRVEAFELFIAKNAFGDFRTARSTNPGSEPAEANVPGLFLQAAFLPQRWCEAWMRRCAGALGHKSSKTTERYAAVRWKDFERQQLLQRALGSETSGIKEAPVEPRGATSGSAHGKA